MKRYLSNQRGSSLMLVMLMVVIFTVLGLTLASQTLTGTKRNDMNEDIVQATYQAEKGLELFFTHLDQYLKELSSISDITAADFDQAIDDFISEYPSSPANQVKMIPQAPFGQVQITASPAAGDKEILSNGFARRIKVQSIGEANEKVKSMRKKYEIIITHVPNHLHYAIGASEDLFLHGSISTVGNLYVGRHLISGNRSPFYSPFPWGPLGLWWKPTDLPTMESIDTGEKPELTVGGNMYKMTSAAFDYLEQIDDNRFMEHTGYNKYSQVNYDDFPDRYQKLVGAEFSQAFKNGYAPHLVERDVEFPPIDITNARGNYAYNSTNTALENGESFGTTDVMEVNDLDNTGTQYVDTAVYNHNDEIEITGKQNIFGRFSSKTEGEVTVRGGATETDRSTLDVGKGMFVKGTLVIGNIALPSPSNSSDFDKLTIQGPIYVDGDLVIKSVDLEIDSTIYVTGKTTISSARILGIEKLNPQGELYNTSLVLFNKGSTDIFFVNFFEDNPEVLRAFIYSESDLEIWTLGSNMKIEGGLFARNVMLNSTKGITRASNELPNLEPYPAHAPESVWFEQDQENINDPTKSRFRIVFNEDLVQNAPEGMPVVSSILLNTSRFRSYE